MNERQLKYILTIAEEGNITTAAQKLYISQPSLSYLLAHVEEELGLKLFDRSCSPMRLTFAGEAYVQAAKKILSIQNELHNQIDDLIDYRKSRLVIGCSARLSSLLIPAVLPPFMKSNPGVQIKLYEESVPVLEELLTSGALELVFTNAMIENKALGRIPLYVEEFLILTPADFTPAGITHKEHHFPVFDLACLEGRPFVLFKHGHQLRDMTDQIFADFGIHPNIILETENWEICYSMAEEGLAFTLLPFSPLTKFMTDNTKKINFYSIDGSYSRQLSAYYRKNTYHHKIIETFIETAQTILDQYERIIS
jgi:DNA-binding transcriptional LysR family regulator